MNQIKAQNNDFRKMIEYAVKAPSGHNTQPWLFKVNENQIEIHPDLTKSLPIVDGDNRELFISLGCAVENICITASTMGYIYKIEIKENNIISIILNKEPSISTNILFDQIEQRQTNRSIYDGRVIANDTLLSLISAIENTVDVNLYCWGKEAEEFSTIKQLIVEGNRLQMKDEAFKRELKYWMRYNKKDAESKKDGLSYAVFGAPNLPSFISKPIMSTFLNAKKQNKGDIKKIDSSSHFILLTTETNNVENWISLGQYLQRFLLTLTKANIAHAYTNQPCELKELSIKLQKTLPIRDEIPQIILRIGYAKPMPYSKRKEIEDVLIEN